MAGWTSLGGGADLSSILSPEMNKQLGVLQKFQRLQGSIWLLHLGVTSSVFHALSGVFLSLTMELLEARPFFPVTGTFVHTKILSSPHAAS